MVDLKVPVSNAHLEDDMPQAVSTYLDTNNLKKVDSVKPKIIKLYVDDFRKIDTTGRITRLFLSIPAQLSNNESRYQPTTVLGNVDSEKMTELLSDLEDGKTVLSPVYMTSFL